MLHGTARDRLGRVPSLEAAVFEVPAAMLGAGQEIILVADPGTGGGESFVTPVILVRPPHTVIDLTIENYIAYSRVFVTVEQS